MSSDFSNQFETFAEDNIEPFVRVLDDGKSPTLEHVEHDHELHDVYRLYLETFEKKIETHIVKLPIWKKPSFQERGLRQKRNISMRPQKSRPDQK